MTVKRKMGSVLKALFACVLALVLVLGFMGLPVQAAGARPAAAQTAAKGITYSKNNKKVTLKNYDGGELYFDKDVTIKLVGTSTIKADIASAPVI
ncbi:MAG: hypothetical protein AB7V55_04365, partial [Oscillospiraceae bacterium]